MTLLPMADLRLLLEAGLLHRPLRRLDLAVDPHVLDSVAGEHAAELVHDLPVVGEDDQLNAGPAPLRHVVADRVALVLPDHPPHLHVQRLRLAATGAAKARTLLLGFRHSSSAPKCHHEADAAGSLCA